MIGEHTSIFDRIEERERRAQARRDAVTGWIALGLAGVVLVAGFKLVASDLEVLRATHWTPIGVPGADASLALSHLLSFAVCTAILAMSFTSWFGAGRRVRPIQRALAVLAQCLLCGAAWAKGEIAWAVTLAVAFGAMILAVELWKRRWPKHGASGRT